MRKLILSSLCMAMIGVSTAAVAAPVTVVLERGADIPENDGGRILRLDEAGLTNDSVVVVSGRGFGGSGAFSNTSRNAIWRFDPDGTGETLVHEGEFIQAGRVGTVAGLTTFRVAESGDVLFGARVDANDPQAIDFFRADHHGRLRHIIGDGDVIGPSGRVDLFSTYFGDDGDGGYYSRANLSVAGQSILQFKEDGSVETVLSRNDDLGIPGLNLSRPLDMVGNGEGVRIFQADYSQLGQGSGRGLFRSDEAGQSELLFASGSSAFHDASYNLVSFQTDGLADDGDMLIYSQLIEPGSSSPTSFALYHIEDDVPALLAARDTEVGNTGLTFLTPRQQVMNANGDILFWGQVDNNGEFGDALFALPDGEGEVKALFKSGDLIELAQGDVRVLRSLSIMADALNDHGEFVFRALFTDGSQAILLSSLNAVPLPAAGMLFVIGLSGLWGISRRGPNIALRPNAGR